VVFNVCDLLTLFSSLDLLEVIVCGYWEQPRGGAKTLYKKIAFGVFAVRKMRPADKDRFKAEMRFPLSLVLRKNEAR